MARFASCAFLRSALATSQQISLRLCSLCVCVFYRIGSTLRLRHFRLERPPPLVLTQICGTCVPWLERRQRCSFNKQLAGEILLPTSHSIAPMMMISECCFFVCGAFLSSCCPSALRNFRSNNMRAWTNEACRSLPVPAQCTNCQHMHWRNIVSCPWSCGAVSAFYYPSGQRLHHRARRVYHLALLPLDRPSEQVLRS